MRAQRGPRALDSQPFPPVDYNCGSVGEVLSCPSAQDGPSGSQEGTVLTRGRASASPSVVGSCTDRARHCVQPNWGEEMSQVQSFTWRHRGGDGQLNTAVSKISLLFQNSKFYKAAVRVWKSSSKFRKRRRCS